MASLSETRVSPAAENYLPFCAMSAPPTTGIADLGICRRYIAPRPPFPWTPELRELSARMWLAGFSATQIAEHVQSVSKVVSPKLSRCSIMGVLHRARVYRDAPGPVERRPKAMTPPGRRLFEGKYA